MRLAAIDVGTNAVLLSIAEPRGATLAPLLERATLTRLGEGVDESRRLQASAISRTLSALEDYARCIDAHAVDRVVAVGTSALRDAGGATQFLDAAERALGTPLCVISGEIEARLTFEGGVSGLGLAGPVVVFDVGGGSTEVVCGRVGDAPEASVSLNIGSVRLFERHVRSDPPAAEELAAVRADIRRALRAAPAAPAAAQVVGVAGTMTTLFALARRLEVYDAAKVHGGLLSSADVAHWAEQLCALPLPRRRAHPGLEPGRADVIPIGALLVQELASHFRADKLIVSDRGVRWGALERLAQGRGLFGV